MPPPPPPQTRGYQRPSRVTDTPIITTQREATNAPHGHQCPPPPPKIGGYQRPSRATNAPITSIQREAFSAHHGPKMLPSPAHRGRLPVPIMGHQCPHHHHTGGYQRPSWATNAPIISKKYGLPAPSMGHQHPNHHHIHVQGPPTPQPPRFPFHSH